MELNQKKETQPSYAEFLKRQGMIKCTNCLQYTSKGNYCEQCGCRLTADDLRGGTKDANHGW
jgi:methionyl-tRNA synthetase